MCSRHFRNGDATQVPSSCLGVKFASPGKMQSARGVRATKRKVLQLPTPTPKRHLPSASPGTISSTPVSSDQTDGESSDFMSGTRLITSAGKACFSDYSVHELPGEESCLDVSGGATFEKGV